MCRPSAITWGRSAGRSTTTACLPPPPANAVRARSTRAPTSSGATSTGSVAAPMRPASIRSAISPSMRSACSSTMRRNWRSSARSGSREPPSAVAAEPLMAASGALSSWLTRPRNSARERSRASNGARSWIVTTTVSTAPSGERIGVASSSVRTLRPSGTESSTSSARTRSALRRSASVASRPSPLRQGHLLRQPLDRAAGCAQPGHDALRLPVERTAPHRSRHRTPRPRSARSRPAPPGRPGRAARRGAGGRGRWPPPAARTAQAPPRPRS